MTAPPASTTAPLIWPVTVCALAVSEILISSKLRTPIRVQRSARLDMRNLLSVSGLTRISPLWCAIKPLFLTGFQYFCELIPLFYTAKREPSIADTAKLLQTYQRIPMSRFANCAIALRRRLAICNATSGVRGIAFQVPGGALAGDSLQIATLAKCIERIGGQLFLSPPLENCRTNVGGKCVLKAGFGRDEICSLLRDRELFHVHQSRFREELLGDRCRLNHRFNLAFQVVALIDGVANAGGRSVFPFKKADLVEYAKHLVGIDGAEREVVIGVPTIVEVKTTQHSFR